MEHVLKYTIDKSVNLNKVYEILALIERFSVILKSNRDNYFGISVIELLQGILIIIH